MEVAVTHTNEEGRNLDSGHRNGSLVGGLEGRKVEREKGWEFRTSLALPALVASWPSCPLALSFHQGQHREGNGFACDF